VQYLALSNNNTQHSYFDFAASGATVNDSVIGAQVPQPPPSFERQVDTFKQYFPPTGEVAWQSSSSLFTVFFGIKFVFFFLIFLFTSPFLTCSAWQRHRLHEPAQPERH
jgi:hypothetical protein